MSLGSPLLLLTLLVLPLLAVIFLFVRRRRVRSGVAFSNLDVLAAASSGGRGLGRTWIPIALIFLSLACAATALAKPSVTKTVPAQAVVVILVDVSGSMQANDIAPTRIAAAVSAMQTFVEKLPPQADVGLVEFSTDATTVELPTTDHSTVEDALSLLAPQGATALGDGLAAAIQDVQIGLAKTNEARQSDPGGFVPAAIVLESDGTQNRGTLQPLQAAQRAKSAGIRVDTVAFGTPKGKVAFVGLPAPVAVPPDPATMQAIARLTGGKTYTAQNASQATSIYGHLGSTLARNHTQHEITSWFALGAGVLLLAAICLQTATGAALP